MTDDGIQMRRSLDSLDSPAVTVREMLLEHDHRLDAHDKILLRVEGALVLMRWVFGASLIGAIGSLFTIWQLLQHSQAAR